MKHDKETIAKADRLRSHMKLDDVADTLDVPRGTVYYWSRSGKISTEKDFHAQSQRKWSDEVIERVDALYDLMPLSEVEDFLDGKVPESTMKDWKAKGWIDSRKNWRAENNGAEYKVAPMKVVNAVRSGKKQKTVAQKYGIGESTVSRYMKLYSSHEL